MEIGVRLIGCLLVFLDFLTTPLFRFIAYCRPHQRLPPIQDPLLLTSVTKIAQLIRDKKFTSQEIVQVFIDRVKAVNPILNAIVEDRFQDAIEDAKKVDELLKSCTDEHSLKELQKNKPLLGVPITVKESCSMKGMSVCGGSLPRRGEKSPSDGEVVSYLRDAGAIPLLVSTTPELCLSWQTSNLVTGVTNNPYNTNRTPGGSSGGEAALISSGASLVGVASDIAGSIRIPALFCGIFGHKPTPGLTSIKGHFPTSPNPDFARFLTIGPLTRYSEDLELMLKVMAGQNYDRVNPEEVINLNNLKVTYMMEATKSLSLIPVDESINNAMTRAVEYLKSQFNSNVKEVHLEEMSDSVDMSISTFFAMEDIPNMLQDEDNPKTSKNLYLEILKAVIGIGMYSVPSLGFYLIHHTNVFIPQSATQMYRKQTAQLKKKIIQMLGTNGVFLYPTFPQSAFYHNQVYTKASGVLYTMLFNVLEMPSTHVPLGLDSNGLPIGIQVIAAPHRDRLCIAVAKELEKGFGGWVPPCDVTK